MSDCGCELEETNSLERKTLVILLVINATMFMVGIVAGWLGDSTALIADSLDMLADALVYGIGLYAVGKALVLKANAAYLSGVLQIGLGLGVLLEVARRFIVGSEPVSELMIGVGLAALVANVTCLYLISKHRHGDVNMRAAWIFSSNDVIANSSVILSGILVFLTNSRIPDLVIAFIISCVVVRGGFVIIREANEVRKKAVDA